MEVFPDEESYQIIKLCKQIVVYPILADIILTQQKDELNIKWKYFAEDQVLALFPESYDFERMNEGILLVRKQQALEKDLVKKDLLIVNLENDFNTAFIYYQDQVINKIENVYLKSTSDIWKRQDPVLNHEALSDKTVAVFGLGSVGSRVALELGRAGVGKLILVDPDRLEIHNIVRHVASLEHIGRKKVNVVKEIINKFNPFAKIETHDEILDEKNPEKIEEIAKGCDLVVVSLGPHEANMLLDNILYPLGVPAVYSGVFRRGYGGTIYTVLPNISGCYNCAHEAFIDKGILDFYMKKFGVTNFSLADLAEEFIDYGSPNILKAEPAINVDISIISEIQAKVALWILEDKNVTELIGQVILIVLNTEDKNSKDKNLDLITTGHLSWTEKSNCTHHDLEVKLM